MLIRACEVSDYVDIRLSGQDDVNRAVPIGREVSINDVQLKAGSE